MERDENSGRETFQQRMVRREEHRRRIKAAYSVLLVLALTGALLSLFIITYRPSPARAHSFYPMECCSDRDCWPMGNEADAKEPEPVFTPAGWKLSDGSIVAFNQTRTSPDGRFHVCRQSGVLNGSVIRPEGRPVCLFAPSHGS